MALDTGIQALGIDDEDSSDSDDEDASSIDYEDSSDSDDEDASSIDYEDSSDTDDEAIVRSMDPNDIYNNVCESMQRDYKSIQKKIHGTNDANAISRAFPEQIPVTEPIRVMDVNQTLASIVSTPDNHTLVDVYFLLSKLAEQTGQNGLMTVSRDIAALIQYYHHRGLIRFNLLTDIQAGRESLLTPLRTLQDTLLHNSAADNSAADNSAADNGAINESTLRLLFGNLYSNVIAIAEAEFTQWRENAVSSSEPDSQIRNFLNDISIITSYGKEGGRYLEESSLGYASSRASFFIEGNLEIDEGFPERGRIQYALHSSLVALYLAFLGENDQALNRLNALASIDPAFNTGEHTDQTQSIVFRVISGVRTMLHHSGADNLDYHFVILLSFLISNPHLPRAPRSMLAASNPDVLREILDRLIDICSQNSGQLGFNPTQRERITQGSYFEKKVFQPLQKEKEKAQKEQEKEKKKKNKDSKSWHFWKGKKK
ncbi:hypothetical protein NX722_01375 [Endozoicomonas gorgoniicola]|uniref:Uncharacterized protein n=1 Tax=Endozoicomonas gorgoniicola TaxID=1234144 RepID=A0ABT3MPM0_9GAMM|nr:hypothetical protein [Endozoicomonas gorgoniicola]MCW7551312.1 hypothetical protein [Endozoicomonas gorgoniicola]